MSISSVGGRASLTAVLPGKGSIVGHDGTSSVGISASTATVALSVDTTAASKLGTVAISTSTVTTAFDLIASNVLTADAASVTFSSIPGTYKSLYIYGQWAPVTTAAVDFQTKWNTHTSYFVIGFSSNSAAPYYSNINTAAWPYGYIVGNSGRTPTNETNFFRMVFPNYASGSKNRVALVSAMHALGVHTQVIGSAAIVGSSLTTAITSLEFSVSSGNLASGSSFLLYGLKV